MSGERGNSHTDPEIGRSLERARAERGLSLWQVEEATKIRARYLHDLERENFDVLPAVYVLGSLKTYADFLGLDGEALARELKSRQEPQPEERDPTPEEPTQSERGGFLAALGGLPLIGDRDALGDDRGDTAPATVLGYGSRLYLGLGAASILVLAIALTAILGGGDQPAVSQVRDPAIPEAPSRIAFSGNVESSKDDERNRDAESKDERSGERAGSSGGGDEKSKKEDEKGQAEKGQAEKGDRDDTPPEDTGDVAVAPAASVTAVSTASASASAAASATSTPVATAPASAPPPATAPPATAPPATAPPATAPAVTAPSTASAAPRAAAPATAPAPPNPEPAPTVVRRVPAATGTPGGSGSGRVQGGGLDRSGLADEISDRVQSATDFAR